MVGIGLIQNLKDVMELSMRLSGERSFQVERELYEGPLVGAYLVYLRNMRQACWAAAEGTDGRRIEGEVQEIIGSQVIYSLLGYWKDFTRREVRNHWNVLSI